VRIVVTVGSDTLTLVLNALVAFGTISLAIATFVVARRTRSLAAETREMVSKTSEVAEATRDMVTATAGVAAATESMVARTTEVAEATRDLGQAAMDDIAAQFRPILIPSRFEHQPLVNRPDVLRVWAWPHPDQFLFAVANAGRGAAVDVVARIRGSNQTVTCPSAIGAFGDPARLVARHVVVQAGGEVIVELTYNSVTSQRFRSEIKIQNVGSDRSPSWEARLLDIREIPPDG
jgi:hypothetical protein